MSKELSCNYDGCDEVFNTHEERTEHSLRQHTDVYADKYPNIIGADSGLKF